MAGVDVTGVAVAGVRTFLVSMIWLWLSLMERLCEYYRYLVVLQLTACEQALS